MERHSFLRSAMQGPIRARIILWTKRRTARYCRTCAAELRTVKPSQSRRPRLTIGDGQKRAGLSTAPLGDGDQFVHTNSSGSGPSQRSITGQRIIVTRGVCATLANQIKTGSPRRLLAHVLIGFGIGETLSELLIALHQRGA